MICLWCKRTWKLCTSSEHPISLDLDITKLYCFQGLGPLFHCLFFCFLSQSCEALQEVHGTSKDMHIIFRCSACLTTKSTWPESVLLVGLVSDQYNCGQPSLKNVPRTAFFQFLAKGIARKTSTRKISLCSAKALIEAPSGASRGPPRVSKLCGPALNFEFPDKRGIFWID